MEHPRWYVIPREVNIKTIISMITVIRIDTSVSKIKFNKELPP